MRVSSLSFSSVELEAFKYLSHDENPLHVDPEYARKTVFGQQVVYGILAVLKSLHVWSDGQSIRLERIQVQFKRPLFLNRNYTLEIESHSECVTIRIMSASRLQAKIKVEGMLLSQLHDCPIGDEAFLQAREDQKVLPGEQIVQDREYAPGSYQFLKNLQTLGFSSGFMEWSQFVFFLWTSFTVGMENPGAQALYSELRASFSKQDQDPTKRHFESMKVWSLSSVKNDVYRVWTLAGKASGVSNFEIHAFERPVPTSLDFDLLGTLSPLSLFKGMQTVIAGGGRGFGAALGSILERNGSAVMSLQRSRSALASQIQQVLGDAAERADSQRAASQFPDKSLDILILNASPTIEAAKFSEMSPENWMEFVSKSLACYLSPFRAFSNKLKDGAVVVCISSAYAEEAPTEFSHYVAAKMALESSWKVFAKEFPKWQFVTYRPPKMKTDQTNTIRPDQSLASPEVVAQDLLQWIESIVKNAPHTDNLHIKGF